MVAAVVVGVVVLGVIAVVLSLVGDSLEPEPIDAPDTGDPSRPLTADDVPRLRFRIGLRGYRMSDVDDALDRLGDALRDAEQRAADQRDAEQRAAGQRAAGQQVGRQAGRQADGPSAR